VRHEDLLRVDARHIHSVRRSSPFQAGAPSTTSQVTTARELVERVGRAIKDGRGGRSAAWLSNRTAELGYRVSPTVIAKLDSGHRGSVLSLAELIVLAAALDTSRVVLAYPGPYGDELIETLPGVEASNYAAAEWFSANRWFGMAEKPGDDPVGRWHANIEPLRQRRHLDELIATRDEMDNPEHIAVLNRQIKAICLRLGIRIPTDDDVVLLNVDEKPANGSNDA
jgi:hypothetical protein